LIALAASARRARRRCCWRRQEPWARRHRGQPWL